MNAAISDLHAADARYHKDCMSKFFSNTPLVCSSTVRDAALDEVAKIMKADTTRMWNSAELQGVYAEHSGSQVGTGQVSSRRYTITPEA